MKPPGIELKVKRVRELIRPGKSENKPQMTIISWSLQTFLTLNFLNS
jgi:hypothetical protein